MPNVTDLTITRRDPDGPASIGAGVRNGAGLASWAPDRDQRFSRRSDPWPAAEPVRGTRVSRRSSQSPRPRHPHRPPRPCARVGCSRRSRWKPRRAARTVVSRHAATSSAIPRRVFFALKSPGQHAHDCPGASALTRTQPDAHAISTPAFTYATAPGERNRGRRCCFAQSGSLSIAVVAIRKSSSSLISGASVAPSRVSQIMSSTKTSLSATQTLLLRSNLPSDGL